MMQLKLNYCGNLVEEHWIQVGDNFKENLPTIEKAVNVNTKLV